MEEAVNNLATTALLSTCRGNGNGNSRNDSRNGNVGSNKRNGKSSNNNGNGNSSSGNGNGSFLNGGSANFTDATCSGKDQHRSPPSSVRNKAPAALREISS